MKQKALFFRLLTSPVPAKGTALLDQVTALNAGTDGAWADLGIFPANPADFAAIPGSPFAYWVSEKTKEIFSRSPIFESNNRHIKSGLKTADDVRFVRLWWEVLPENISWITKHENGVAQKWVAFAKGGNYLLFYSDLHLIVNWGARQDISNTPWSDLGREDYYGRPGLTYPTRTTSGFSPRILPAGSIFGHKGSSIFFSEDNFVDLLAGLSICASKTFESFIKLSLGAADMAARSYEVGIIQKMPWAKVEDTQSKMLAHLAIQAHELNRQRFINDETTHGFCLPALLRAPGVTFAKRLQAIAQIESERQARLAALQAQMDSRVAELYGIPELANASQPALPLPNDTEHATRPRPTPDDDDDESETTPPITNPYSLVADFLMWCIGVAFGRWDIRYALHPETLPPLPGPFDPLPVYAPGALLPSPIGRGAGGEVGSEVAFLVDDPTHARDILTALRAVFNTLWPGQADDIAAQACQLLGVPDLRTWLRDPKGFFAWHIKRYSKSRRKAPIYWLIQSARKSYAIWLYYPRLNPDSLFFAAREFADAKRNLEISRLEDLQNGLERATGATRKAQERAIAQQTTLVGEIKTFIQTLDTAALLEHKPDLNDGVLLNMAPLHALVPWKEPQRAWDELLQGKYAWSAIATHLHQKKLVKGARLP